MIPVQIEEYFDERRLLLCSSLEYNYQQAYNSRLLFVQMLPQNPMKHSLQLHNQDISKNTEPLLRHQRPMSNLSNTCIAKTITNCFLLPQKIPKALEERFQFKNTLPRPFFTKNRKFIESNQKRKWSKRHSEGNASLAATNNDFTQILKAKSTVIKQNRLKEFYINRQGRKQAEQLINYSVQNFKSNLFKPNFPKKKTRNRRNSLYVVCKPTDSIEVPPQHLKIQTKTLNISQSGTIQHQDCILREKQYVFHNILNKMPTPNRSLKSSQPQPQPKQRLFWRRNHRQKQNIDFALQPWGNYDLQDTYF